MTKKKTMKNISYINNNGKHGVKYFYLHLGTSLSYYTKKYLNYATFSFKYNTEWSATNSYNVIIKNLKVYMDTDKFKLFKN